MRSDRHIFSDYYDIFHQNSVPQIPGMGDASTSFPGGGGQFPGVPQPTGLGLPAVPGVPQPIGVGLPGVPGVPTEQLPSTGGIPSQAFPPGITELPSGIGENTPGLQTPGIPLGNFPAGIPTQGLIPQEVSSNMGTAQGLPGLPTSSTPLGIATTGPGQMPPMQTGSQYSDDTMTPPYAGAAGEMGDQQLQEMGLPPGMPNPDLLVRTDLCNEGQQ